MIIEHLVTTDLAHAKILRLRMREVKAAHRAGGPHGAALGKFDSSAFLNVQQVPQNPFFRMVGTRGITSRRTNSTIFLADQLLAAEVFAFAVAPFLAGALMQALGEGFGKAVGECFRHDRIVVVMILLESGAEFVHAKAR